MKRMILASDAPKCFLVSVICPDGHTSMWKKFATKPEATEFIYKLRTQARYWDQRKDKCTVTVTNLDTDEIIKRVQLGEKR